MTILVGDCVEQMRSLPDRSVHCCITSPPYWGLRDYGVSGQLGLEKTPEEYVASMVNVFREVRRVLRDDGTLWLNIGDSYNARPGQRKTADKVGKKQETNQGSNTIGSRSVPSLKPKELVGIPWMLAFALRADGWWLRQDIIWAKGNPMPESVTDRCTKSHEYLFLLAKNGRYYYDHEAVKERAQVGANGSKFHVGKTAGHQQNRTSQRERVETTSRNRRSVWTINTESCKLAHFATFPTKLVEPCILAGTSAAGCCQACGKPWKRLVDRTRVATRNGENSKVNAIILDPLSPYQSHHGEIVGNRDPKRHCTVTETLGWQPTCTCSAPAIPCTVLDPFGGSGTTAGVATFHGRHAILCELNPEYSTMVPERVKTVHKKLAKAAKPPRSKKPKAVAPKIKDDCQMTLPLERADGKA